MALNHSPRIVTNGLVLCLDAANSKSYSGSGTTWRDLSGNGRNGTLTNGPTFNSDNGGSIVFDGSNDFVNFSSQISITFNVTYNFWIRWSGASRFESVLGNEATQNTANFGLGIRRRLDNTYWMSQRAGIEPMLKVTPTNPNLWHMATAVLNGTQALFYQNSQLLGSANWSTQLDSPNNFRVGTMIDILDYFTGNISLVQIYNRALTATEIQQNFNALRGRFGI